MTTKKKTIKIATILTSLLLAVNMSACSVSKTTNNEQKDAPKDNKGSVLTFGLMPSVDAVPFIIAEKQGLFSKNGVNVKLEFFKSAKDRDAALQSGELDGISTDLVAIGIYQKGGYDVKTTAVTDAKYQLIAGKDSKIENIQDIKGKKVVISRNTVIEFTLDSILNKSGLTEKDIVKEEIPQIPVRLEMLRNNKVEAALLPEPFSSLAMKDGGKLISDSQALSLAPGVSAFTKKAIDNKSSEIKAFYKAYDAAVDYLTKEPISSYEDIVIKEVGYPEDMKGNIKLPAFRKTTLPSEQDLEAAINWLKDKKLSKEDIKKEDLISDIAVKK